MFAVQTETLQQVSIAFPMMQRYNLSFGEMAEQPQSSSTSFLLFGAVLSQIDLSDDYVCLLMFADGAW